MALTFYQSPTSGVETDGIVTMSARVVADGTYVVTGIKISWRVNGGAWNSNSKLGEYTLDLTHTYTLYLTGGGDHVDWYYTYYYEVSGHSDSDTRGQYVYDFDTAVDIVAPTLNSYTPANSATVYPGSDQEVDFTISATDAFFLDKAELYVADVLKDTDTDLSATLTTDTAELSCKLNKATYDWYIKVYDVAGNIATSTTRSVTVGNVVPTAPGTPAVGGLTTVSVSTEYTVTWTASVDYNQEDTVTYDLEVQYGSAGWNNVAADIAGLSQAWTPSTAGAAYLRVHAKDGTGDSTYSGTRTLTVDETDPPNAPTLTAPTGAETWEEGETQNVTWTKASPEHPDSLACTYEAEFSADGTFGDLVSLFSGQTGVTWAWTLATTLVAADTATCKVRVRARDSSGKTSSWSTSAAGFDVLENACPAVTLVTPTDAGDIQKTTTTTFVFLVDDADDDPAHVELQISEFADFRSYVVSQDTATDYASWEESETPFTTWTTMTDVGGTHDYQVRYVSSYGFRYDTYYGRVRVSDNALTSDWTVFSFTVISDPTSPLTVTIGGNAFNVCELVIVENTGGEASPVNLSIPLGAWLDEPCEAGDAIAIASGLGGHARTWNATLESWTFSGSLVSLYGLQDDAYLSRKLATGNEASADLGQNLKDFVTSYGTPLDGDGIDTTILASIALTGGYKTLREHFEDAMNMAPNYVLWVDSAGHVYFVAQSALTAPLYDLYEETP